MDTKRNKLCTFFKEIMDQHDTLLNSLKCPHVYTDQK